MNKDTTRLALLFLAFLLLGIIGTAYVEHQLNAQGRQFTDYLATYTLTAWCYLGLDWGVLLLVLCMTALVLVDFRVETMLVGVAGLKGGALLASLFIGFPLPFFILGLFVGSLSFLLIRRGCIVPLAAIIILMSLFTNVLLVQGLDVSGLPNIGKGDQPFFNYIWLAQDAALRQGQLLYYDDLYNSGMPSFLDPGRFFYAFLSPVFTTIFGQDAPLSYLAFLVFDYLLFYLAAYLLLSHWFDRKDVLLGLVLFALVAQPELMPSASGVLALGLSMLAANFLAKGRPFLSALFAAAAVMSHPVAVLVLPLFWLVLLLEKGWKAVVFTALLSGLLIAPYALLLYDNHSYFVPVQSGAVIGSPEACKEGYQEVYNPAGMGQGKLQGILNLGWSYLSRNFASVFTPVGGFASTGIIFLPIAIAALILWRKKTSATVALLVAGFAFLRLSYPLFYSISRVYSISAVVFLVYLARFMKSKAVLLALVLVFSVTFFNPSSTQAARFNGYTEISYDSATVMQVMMLNANGRVLIEDIKNDSALVPLSLFGIIYKKPLFSGKGLSPWDWNVYGGNAIVDGMYNFSVPVSSLSPEQVRSIMRANAVEFAVVKNTDTEKALLGSGGMEVVIRNEEGWVFMLNKEYAGFAQPLDGAGTASVAKLGLNHYRIDFSGVEGKEILLAYNYHPYFSSPDAGVQVLEKDGKILLRTGSESGSVELRFAPPLWLLAVAAVCILAFIALFIWNSMTCGPGKCNRLADPQYPGPLPES